MRICFVLFALSTLSYCSEKGNQLAKAEWLLGTWECQTPKGPLYETWVKMSDLRFSGKSYYLNNRDTILFETVDLEEKEHQLSYNVRAPKQKNERPVVFIGTAIDNNKFTVENEQHDFPQVITYTKINADSLVAVISGKVNGVLQKEEFAMKKIK